MSSIFLGKAGSDWIHFNEKQVKNVGFLGNLPTLATSASPNFVDFFPSLAIANLTGCFCCCHRKTITQNDSNVKLFISESCVKIGSGFGTVASCAPRLTLAVTVKRNPPNRYQLSLLNFAAGAEASRLASIQLVSYAWAFPPFLLSFHRTNRYKNKLAPCSI